jgi:hypothetical protein
MADDIVTTDHSAVDSKREQLAAIAVWEITTLCDELLEHAAKLDTWQPPRPHHSAIIIKLLACRAHELAEAAALCLNEDEATKPFAELESVISRGCGEGT